MDDELISECNAIAKSAFQRSAILTIVLIVAFFALAAGWFSNYLTYPFTSLAVWREHPQWVLPTKTIIVAALLLYCSVRPESLYALVKRYRDRGEAKKKADEAAFERRVKKASENP